LPIRAFGGPDRLCGSNHDMIGVVMPTMSHLPKDADDFT